MNSVVLALSGGMDSATLCGYYLDKGFKVNPVIFNYGSKHNKYENEMAFKLCEYWKLEPKYVELPFMNTLFKSNLLLNGEGIPEGHYEDKNMSLTVVPGRNLIFLSILMGYAWSVESEIIAFGAHSGDHFIYPDTRPEFVAAANTAIMIGSENKVRVEAPFIYLNKTSILDIGFKLDVPYQYTRTCYCEQELSCSSCGACVERLEAFANHNRKDPIHYQ